VTLGPFLLSFSSFGNTSRISRSLVTETGLLRIFLLISLLSGVGLFIEDVSTQHVASDGGMINERCITKDMNDNSRDILKHYTAFPWEEL